jgi:glycosyltransferase involved in cell wall biosynthesis
MTPGEPGSMISAILPNYNHARYLRDAVRSLASQDPRPQEIIVIDDASTDDSLAVLAELGGEIPCLRILREDTNRGAIAALNRGLAEASYPYLYFGAADDIALPGLFAATMAALRRYPDAGFAACECVVTDFSGRRTGFRPPIRPSYGESFFPPDQVQRLLRRSDNWALTGAAVFRRDLVRAAGGFDDTAGSFADGLLVRRLALRSGFVFVPMIGFNWRINPAGLSRSASSGVDASRQMLSSMLEHVEADPIFPSWYAPLLKRRWRFNVGRIATVESRPMRADLLVACCSHNGLDRAVYRLASAIWYPAGVFVALVWLTLRERPMSLTGVFLTALARRFQTLHG